MIGIGGAVQANFEEIEESLEDQTKAIKGAALISVVVGGVMIFVSLFGILSIILKNYKMVTAFAVMLSICLILEIAACCLAFALRGKIIEYLHHEVVKVVQTYSMEEDHVFDDIQQKFQCCAWNSTLDYEFAPLQEEAALIIEEIVPDVDQRRIPVVPDSCCLDIVEYCGMSLKHPVYDIGCVEVVSAKLKKAVFIVAMIVLGVMLVQLVTIIFACYTRRAFKMRAAKVGGA